VEPVVEPPKPSPEAVPAIETTLVMPKIVARRREAEKGLRFADEILRPDTASTAGKTKDKKKKQRGKEREEEGKGKRRIGLDYLDTEEEL
jgi:hypothetical protein